MIVRKLLGKFTDQLAMVVAENNAMAIVLADEDGRIIDSNMAFRGFLEIPENETLDNLYNYLDNKAAEMLKASYDGEFQLKLRLSNGDVASVLIGCHVCKKEGELLIVGQQPYLQHSESLIKLSEVNVELAQLSRELARKNRELTRAKNEIKTISGLIPICSYCKSIKNDSGAWERLEIYLADKSDAMFSHGICENCYDDVLADFRRWRHENLNGDSEAD